MDCATTDCSGLDESIVFLSYFKDLPDTRQKAKVSYPLDEALLLCLLAVLAGAETFVDIALFGDKNLVFLRRFRRFSCGTPAHDHLGDILATTDADHGRIETRTTTVLHNVDWLQQRHQWPGLQAVIVIDNLRRFPGLSPETDKIEGETRFYITSLIVPADQMGPIVRSHRMVENGLHWVMDMVFHDDECRGYWLAQTIRCIHSTASRSK